MLALPELEELEALSQHLTLDKGQTLFGQGEPAGSVFNVIEGVLRLTRLLPDGRGRVMGFALPGDFLGLALQERHSVSAEALGPVTTCRFGRQDFADVVDLKPHLLKSLHERAGYELTLAQDQMLLLGRRTAEEKVAAFLLTLRDRFARTGHGSVTVELPMGRQDMADYHKLSTRWIRENQAIHVETLSLRGLARTRLARSRYDAAWGYCLRCSSTRRRGTGAISSRSTASSRARARARPAASSVRSERSTSGPGRVTPAASRTTAT